MSHFPLPSSQIVQLLHDGGLTTYVFKSVQEDELIVKIRASLDRLRTQADMLGEGTCSGVMVLNFSTYAPVPE